MLSSSPEKLRFYEDLKEKIDQISYGSLRWAIDGDTLKKHNIPAFYTKFRR